MEEIPDFDDSIFGQNLGSATAGVPTTGGIGMSGDRDWFEVTLVAGNQYEIQVRGSSTNDGTLNDPLLDGVYDFSGVLISGSRDDDSGIGSNSQTLFTASYTGTHYFSVSESLRTEPSGGTYTLEYFDLNAAETLNEGDDITLSIPTEIPFGISTPFPGTGSPDERIADRQISVAVTSANAIEGEDFTVTYSFGQSQSLTFAALLDELVEDDETVSVRVTGFVDWIVPSGESSTQLNLLGNPVNGFIDRTTIDFTRSFTINSAPFGVPDPIIDYTFTGPDIIGNVLTNFADGSEETFTAIPFSFESPTVIGELLENGDISITDSTASPGQTVIVRFSVIDERGATTRSEQEIRFGALADDYLPGETALDLGSIDIGFPEIGSVERAEDRDRFLVTLEGGQLYSIGLTSASTDSGTLADPAIFGIFDSLNVALPGSSDNDSGIGRNALLDPFFVETSGTYEIEVGSNTSFGIGGYELSVLSLGDADDFLPGPFADVFGTAVVDVPSVGSIERTGDRDRFDVTLQAGFEYDISLEGLATGGGSNPNPDITGVFSSTGALVPGSADTDSGTGTNALVSGLTVATDGIYQVEVAGAQGLSTGDYTLTVNFAGFVDDFLPGISGGVGTVAIGGLSTGEIEATGDIDAFRVALQSNATYQINILGQESNSGTLLDPNLVGIFSTSDLSGSPVTSVQTLNQQLVGDDSVTYFTPQAAGDYFIGVQDEFGGLGSYTVEVIDLGFRDDFSADIDTTGSIAPGGSASGRIDFAQDNDWFEVNLAAGRLYEISLVPTGGAGLEDPFFNGVYDSDGVLIQNTSNDDGGSGTSSSLQFVTDESGLFYLSAGGFGASTGQYRLDVNDLGPLDDGQFDITVEFSSDTVSDRYIRAFEDAVERWEDIIVGDLPYDFVDGYGYVDDILIEVAIEDIELTFEGVEQTILAISSVLDQRDGISGASALPTYSRVVINSEEVGALLNLDEFVANTIGRALGFGSLWEEFGIVRLIDGVATYTGANGLREMSELSEGLNGVNALEDGADGALAAEYWSEDVFDEELMTPRVELRRPEVGPGNPGIPDNPISALTIAAMQDLGYRVDYGEADRFRLDPGALSRQDHLAGHVTAPTGVAQATASQRLISDLSDTDGIPNGAAYIYSRPNILSESPRNFTLTDANTFLVPVASPGTNAFFIESATGETLNIELKGTFVKNSPTKLSQLSGTVESMEVRSLDGDLLFSVDYTQQPVSVDEIRSQWPNYPVDGENIIIIDTLPGTVVRVNPNGGGENASRIFTGASNDFVRGGDLAELINGGADNDTLEGAGGNDSLIGEAGNDVLEGGRGNDLINGGAGIDTAVFSGAQSAYTLTLSPDSTIIQDRRGDGNGQDTLINIELLDFDTGFFPGSAFDLQQFGGPTGLSASDFESFIELYIAYFNRAPDAVGLNFWGTAFANGVSLAESARLFVTQDETIATYPSDLSNSELVATIYQNVLGRIPDQAGFDFWVDALESGGIGRDIAILGILEGAKADPAADATQDFISQQLADRAYLADKTDIGAYFAVHKGMSDVDNAAAAMALFNGSDDSIAEAVSAIDSFHDAALNPSSGEFLMPLVGVLDDPFAAA